MHFPTSGVDMVENCINKLFVKQCDQIYFADIRIKKQLHDNKGFDESLYKLTQFRHTTV